MFNPFLIKIKDVQRAKKTLLSSLIAEKIIFLESQKAGFSQKELSKRIEHHLKEAMIEQLRRDSVEKKIDIAPQELQEEFLESLKERKIEFIAFASQEEALQAKLAIDSGLSFEQVVSKYMAGKGWQDKPIPQKQLQWGGRDSEIREHIKNLTPGCVSDPVKAFGSFYLVKVLGEYRTAQPTAEEFNRRRPALEDYLRRKKIAERYTRFYYNSLIPYLGDIRLDRIGFLLDELLTKSNYFTKSAKDVSREKELSDQIYLSTAEVLANSKNTEVVRFPDGHVWKFEDLMEELRFGPYNFNYKNISVFKRTFLKNVRLSVEFEALYKLAQKQGYAHHPDVRREAEMWKSYLQASGYRFKFLEDLASRKKFSQNKVKRGMLSPLQEFRLDAIDSLLANALPAYKIKVNKKVYDDIAVPKTDMLVVKKHFAHRLVAPLLQPYSGLPEWQRKVDSLLEHFGII